MIDYSNIIQTILKNKKALATPNGNLTTWRMWYMGKPTAFHRYEIYNGKNTIHKTRLSAKMGKQVAEDWASLLMNEKVGIGVASQDLLEKLLLDINFYNKANKSVEYGFGLSMAGLTVEVEDLELEPINEQEQLYAVKPSAETKVNVSVYSATKTVPITFENNEIVECAFVQENTDNVKIALHLRNEDKTYKIIVAECDKTGNLKKQFEIQTQSKVPFFVIVHPQLVNNIDVDSPYPIAVFANAIDTLKGIDAIYDSYVNEFILGRKRIFVGSELNNVNKESGQVEVSFDPNDAVYHNVPKGSSINGEDKPFVMETNGELRAQQHAQALQDLLNLFSKQCGLGVDYYRFEKGRVQTATQVISEKSDTFRNLKKHEGIFEKALNTIIRALMYAYNNFTLSQEKFVDIDQVAITFDDSIIEDKATEKANDQKDVEFGAMSLIAYRMKWFAETEEEAQKSVRAIYGDAELLKRLTNYAPFLQQGAITPEDFVKNVYIDLSEQEQNELALKIEEQVKASGTAFDETALANIYNPQGE